MIGVHGLEFVEGRPVGVIINIDYNFPAVLSGNNVRSRLLVILIVVWRIIDGEACVGLQPAAPARLLVEFQLVVGMAPSIPWRRFFA